MKILISKLLKGLFVSSDSSNACPQPSHKGMGTNLYRPNQAHHICSLMKSKISRYVCVSTLCQVMLIQYSLNPKEEKFQVMLIQYSLNPKEDKFPNPSKLHQKSEQKQVRETTRMSPMRAPKTP